MNARAPKLIHPTGLIARRWLEQPGVVVLDTETTGLGADAEVCEIAAVDALGEVVIDARIRPSRPIPIEATRIHGIADADVRDCPTWAEAAAGIASALQGRPVCIYNAAYDLRILVQTAEQYGLVTPVQTASCAMQLYAEFYGERDDLRGGYRWQKLGNAARQMGLDVPADLHSARADAELTRRLLLAMAS